MITARLAAVPASCAPRRETGAVLASSRVTQANPRLAALSVDLDDLACYWGIHGLAGAPPAESRQTVLRRALPRFRALFDELGVRATFFVIGRDLASDQEGRALLATLAAEGHELASHTQSHPYHFTTLGPDEIAREVDAAHAALTTLTGQAPVGFRAPGYAITATVLEVLSSRGYLYDSSAFPSWPYYAAKAAVMGGLRLLGRASASHLDHPAVLAAPTTPYHPDLARPYQRGDCALWELPMAVTPGLRLPVIGTSLVTAPAWMRRRLVAACLEAPFLNLELHGIDLVDAHDDQVPAALVARQPDLRRAFATKREALADTVREARARGYRFLPLRDVVVELAGAAKPPGTVTSSRSS